MPRRTSYLVKYVPTFHAHVVAQLVDSIQDLDAVNKESQGRSIDQINLIPKGLHNTNTNNITDLRRSAHVLDGAEKIGSIAGLPQLRRGY